MSPELEGVTKFELDYRPAPALPAVETVVLDAWRTILWRAGLIGVDPERYGGAGFGNLSRRLAGDARFIISGTQTGALPFLDASHYVVIEHADPVRNRVVARGPIAPSSESLTHAMLYALDPVIHYVFHIHSPEIWRNAAALALPTTAANVAYGTPAMAEEMARLYAESPFRLHGVVVMGGHEDGVIAVGRDADETGMRLLAVLRRALAVAVR